MKTFLSFIFLTFPLWSFGQETFKGKAKIDKNYFIPFTIKNENTNEVWTSDEIGRFSIRINEGDVLTFSHQNAFDLKIQINRRILDNKNTIIQLISNHTELTEMVIDTNDTLSLLSQNFSSGKPLPPDYERAKKRVDEPITRELSNQGLGIGFSLNFDAIANRISGRRKRVTQWAEYERNEKKYHEFTQLYSYSFFSTEHHIKEEDIPFLIYELITKDSYSYEKASNKTAYAFTIQQAVTDFKNKNNY